MRFTATAGTANIPLDPVMLCFEATATFADGTVARDADCVDVGELSL